MEKNDSRGTVLPRRRPSPSHSDTTRGASRGRLDSGGWRRRHGSAAPSRDGSRAEARPSVDAPAVGGGDGGARRARGAARSGGDDDEAKTSARRVARRTLRPRVRASSHSSRRRGRCALPADGPRRGVGPRAEPALVRAARRSAATAPAISRAPPRGAPRARVGGVLSIRATGHRAVGRSAPRTTHHRVPDWRARVPGGGRSQGAGDGRALGQSRTTRGRLPQTPTTPPSLRPRRANPRAGRGGERGGRSRIQRKPPVPGRARRRFRFRARRRRRARLRVRRGDEKTSPERQG